MKWLALLAALAGCDKLFDLEPVPDPGDDATPVCNPIGHDEDGDSEDDACDPCPTYTPLGTDTDGDGLPDECDRDNAPSGQDRILAYWTFATESLMGLSASGSVAYQPGANGQWVINGGSSFTTSLPIAKATRVDFHIAGIELTALVASELSIDVNGVIACRFRGLQCNQVQPGVCVSLAGGASSSWPLDGSLARRISLFRSGVGSVACEISDQVGNMALALGTGDSQPGTLGLTTNADASVTLQAIVIYGEK